ncbi:head-tail joining protein [Carnimonas bestiolae]|uniref:head-tail joining protein n=1 Tax=Carnimonas bestiolae TaxID=3402172 RepID=UPI003EDBC91F
MAFPDLDDRLNEAVSSHLCDGIATYLPTGGGAVSGVPYQRDREYQVYREGSELPENIDTVVLRVASIPRHRIGDLLDIEGARYELLRVVEDDGAWRRIEIA